MKWKKRDSFTTVEEVVQKNSGRKLNELLNPKYSTEIVNLDKAAKVVRRAIDTGQEITIVGDYDADGICGAAILFIMFRTLGITPKVRLPKRFSEGYGFNLSMLDEINSGLLITVDNGIAAVDEITEARRRGIATIILDHHPMREDGKLPPAHVLVDPHVYNNGDFEDFCGAGLAYMLARKLISADFILKNLSALAAIATVADVVPLVDDNRRIVKDGLLAIKNGVIPVGLKTLLSKLKLFDVDESDISFTLGPILNAPGRMLDDGAMKSFELLAKSVDADKVDELISINYFRREKQAEGLTLAEQVIEDDCMFGDAALVICSKKTDNTECIHEGVAGVLAGKLSEKYRVPTIVLTESGTPGLMKGSGRSYGDIDFKELLDGAASLLTEYGGHPKAVGIKIEESKVSQLRDYLIEQLTDKATLPEDEVKYYDLDVETKDLETVIAKINRYAPYGEGNPRPVIRIENLCLVPRASRYYSFMGKGSQHIKLFCGRNVAAVGFDMGEQFIRLGEPIRLTLVGSVFVNKYVDPVGRRSKECQIRLEHIEKAIGMKNASPLLASIYANIEAMGGTCGNAS